MTEGTVRIWRDSAEALRLEAQCNTRNTDVRLCFALRKQDSVDSDKRATRRQLTGTQLVCTLLGPNTLKKPTVATPWNNPTCHHTDHH